MSNIVSLIRWLTVSRVKAQGFDDDLVTLDRKEELQLSKDQFLWAGKKTPFRILLENLWLW